MDICKHFRQRTTENRKVTRVSTMRANGHRHTFSQGTTKNRNETRVSTVEANGIFGPSLIGIDSKCFQMESSFFFRHVEA